MILDQSRTPERPIPGYYALKLVRGGPDVACRIVEVQNLWVVMIGGVPTHSEAQEDWRRCPKIEAVAFYGRRITPDQYDALLTAAAEAKPGEPLASPTEPISWRNSPSLY